MKGTEGIECVRSSLVILGGGLAAHASADAAARAGIRDILMLRSGSGASPFVHGIGIPLGRDDSIERFVSDTYEGGYRQGSYALVKTLCSRSLAAKETILSLGMAFNRTNSGEIELLQPVGASVPRVVSVGNALGAHALAALQKRLSGSVTTLDARAVRLFREGRSFCVLAYRGGKPVLLLADAVIVATGGFGRLWSFSTNGSDLGGDGAAMAFRLGAELVDMEFVQFEPSVAVAPSPLVGKSVITTMFYEGAVLKNRLGERFMPRYDPAGERAQKDVLSRAIATELSLGRGTENGGVYYDCTGVGREKLQTRYSAYYERYAACGIDLAEQAIEIAPGAHTTLGGIVIDEACRTTVEGLYACGEAAGGIHGANRLGGNAGLETFVFGAIAGESAARDLAGREHASGSSAERAAREFLGARKQPFSKGKRVRERLARGMTERLGVIRTREGLTSLLADLEEMRSSLPASAEEECLRLENDLLTAKITTESALLRRGSVGCHFRADGAEETRRYRIVAGDGTIERRFDEEDHSKA